MRKNKILTREEYVKRATALMLELMKFAIKNQYHDKHEDGEKIPLQMDIKVGNFLYCDYEFSFQVNGTNYRDSESKIVGRTKDNKDYTFTYWDFSFNTAIYGEIKHNKHYLSDIVSLAGRVKMYMIRFNDHKRYLAGKKALRRYVATDMIGKEVFIDKELTTKKTIDGIMSSGVIFTDGSTSKDKYVYTEYV